MGALMRNASTKNRITHQRGISILRSGGLRNSISHFGWLYISIASSFTHTWQASPPPAGILTLDPSLGTAKRGRSAPLCTKEGEGQQGGEKENAADEALP